MLYLSYNKHLLKYLLEKVFYFIYLFIFANFFLIQPIVSRSALIED